MPPDSEQGWGGQGGVGWAWFSSKELGLVMGLWEMILECGWGNARTLFSPLGNGGPSVGTKRSCVPLPFQDCSSLTETETGQDQ